MAPMRVPFMKQTHTPNLVEFRENNFFDPPPPTVPQVRPLGHDPGRQIKIPSDMFYIFHV